jgi:hypothetical protein
VDVRRVLILLLGAVVFVGPAGAVAASLGVSPGGFGSGQAAVTACDGDFGTVYTTVSGNVTSVSVTGIAGACAGGALTVALTNSAGTAIGSGGPVTVSGGAAAVSIAGAPDGELVAGIRISIEGP